MPEDWQCPNTDCMNHTKMVFGKKSSCPKCGTARNAKQAGDWQCPNTQCLNHKNTVFAKKSSCPKCGAPRPGCYPDSARFPQVAVQQPGIPSVAIHPHLLQQAVVRLLQSQTQQQQLQQQLQHLQQPRGGSSGHPGDWRCPNPSCMNSTRMVFAKHMTCPQCGSAKSSGSKGNSKGNAGDWQCPDPTCKNHRNNVFAKHSSCPACGSERPDGDASVRHDRSRSPHLR